MFPMNISSTEKKSHSTPMWETMIFQNFQNFLDISKIAWYDKQVI